MVLGYELIAVVQARVFLPLIIMAHEPQTPSRQERRKVKLLSMSFLILIMASNTIGAQCSISSS